MRTASQNTTLPKEKYSRKHAFLLKFIQNLGILLAIPVLMVVIPLLISSDVAFAGFIKSLFENITLTVFKIIVGLIITPFVIAYCFALKNSERKEYTPSKFGGIDNTIVISFLSAISICYLTYLFSQLAYFFSAFKGFLPEGYEFNVSTYARRGFFEMSAIAAINFLVIFGSLLLSKKKKGKMYNIKTEDMIEEHDFYRKYFGR